MNADWTDTISWAYVLVFIIFGFWVIEYAREYWYYWKKRDQELERIRRRE